MGQQRATTDGSPRAIVGEWRPKLRVRWFYASVTGVVSALMGAIAVGSVIAVAVGGVSPLAALGAIVYLPIGSISGRLAAGCWRSRVTIDSDSVVVVGAWRTRRVPLEQVARFEARRYGTASAAVWLVRTLDGPARDGIGPRGSMLLWATQRGGTIATNLKSLVASLAPLAAEMNEALLRAAARSR
jgi:hypothetical protein